MRSSIKLFSLFAFLCLLSFSYNADAQQKVGYLDPEAILPNMPEYRAAKSELANYTKILEKQLEGERAKIQQYTADIVQKAQTGGLSPQQQKTEEAKIMQMQQALQKKAQQFDQDLLKKEGALTKPMYEKFSSAVKAVAKAEQLNYVLDKKMFLFSDKGINITSKVKAQLGI